MPINNFLTKVRLHTIFQSFGELASFEFHIHRMNRHLWNKPGQIMLNFAEQTGSGAVMIVWSFLPYNSEVCEN